MSNAKPSLQRERQSVYCCGKNYQRWRFKGQKFPDARPARCSICDNEILWPRYAGPVNPRKSSLQYYYRRRSKFYANGLTSHGDERSREISVVQFVVDDIDAAAAAIAECFPLLPSATRDAVFRLSKTLAKIRGQIVKVNARQQVAERSEAA